ncbi:uncharacterized protein ColSpa_03650 [Colletotrichum spaethianum]|uniref:Uncharacterized protein n=1 Tax=Colletotrichum spaethianum TaxID=700344 RepID=A0AA37LBF0_9PEZI|nr:uncharacterized protein ColSpa_03650 [Colletotrichum spaethianum]GKT43469.1 hypothetical protein ColSpa_03650 [Colletotrichum spaethianum]
MSMIGEPQHERPSLDESPKTFLQVQVQDFGTSSLDIDLQTLEAFRIAPQSQPQKAAEAEQQKPQRTSTMTPIADMFARRATTLAPAVVNMSSLNKSSPSLITSPVNKPGRVPAEERRPSLAPSHAAHAPSPTASVTIISSSHGQSHSSKPWPPPATSRVVAPIRTQVLTSSGSKQPNSAQLREPRRAAFVPSSPAPINTLGPISKPRQNFNAVAEPQGLPQHAEKRHSTPAAKPLLITVPSSLPAENARADRRRSWQQAPTSHPSGMSTPSAPPSASAPWRGITNRQVSARLGTDRLAWIRELEESKKNRPTISGDLPVLRTMQGSVADKLAKFESKQLQQQPVPLTRSNSTRSRTTSVADTFSSYGGMTTTRSSLDSHRTSSVFSHYDDSFREKMELITGNANRKAADDNEEKLALTRVTSTFVSVGKRHKQANVDKAEAV